MPYESERDAAIFAAMDAARVIRSFAGRLSAGEVQEKGVHDLVTAADIASEKVIFESLNRAFPTYGFLAEEGTDTGDADSEPSRPRWIVDPVDGTTNFAHQQPPFCVSIALEVECRMVVGVVYELGRDELFVATRGGGAFRNGAPVRVSRTTRMGEALMTTGFPFRSFRHVDAYLAAMRRFMLDARGLRRPGSAAADLAAIACGRMDGFFEVGLSAWDVAAGSLLIEEAGGSVTDLAGGPRWLHGRQVVASNGPLHPEMIDRLEPLRRAVSFDRFGHD